MDRKKYQIKLRGCDANTIMEFELSDTEVELLKKVAQKSEEVSVTWCMPELEIREYSDKNWNY